MHVYDPSHEGYGYNMVAADDLDPDSIRDALHDGRFYASNGLTFAEIGVEDEVIFVETEEWAACRFVGSGGRLLAENDGTLAEYSPQGDEGYVRVECHNDVELLPGDPLFYETAWSQPFWIVPQ